MDKVFEQLKEKQKEIDESSFFIKDRRYAELEPIDILKHNCFHLVNLVSKVSRFCEQEEHDRHLSPEQIKNEVVPDLIIYALQFANQLDVDIDAVLKERQEFVLKKYD
jgi:hypothetical protein